MQQSCRRRVASFTFISFTTLIWAFSGRIQQWAEIPLCFSGLQYVRERVRVSVCVCARDVIRLIVTDVLDSK